MPISYDFNASQLARLERKEAAHPLQEQQDSPLEFSAQLHQARRNVQFAHELALTRTPARSIPSAKALEDVEQTAEDMESLFIGQLLKAMWKTLPESEYGMKGTAGEIYRDMFIDEVSRLASQGPGIGLKRVISESMLDLQANKSSPFQIIA